MDREGISQTIIGRKKEVISRAPILSNISSKVKIEVVDPVFALPNSPKKHSSTLQFSFLNGKPGATYRKMMFFARRAREISMIRENLTVHLNRNFFLGVDFNCLSWLILKNFDFWL